tara:strand:- start:321 stop:455 length:135 start_codon:yes stop_codon:yes gene_type:complete
MVRRGEHVNFGGLWLKGHGLSVGPEVMGSLLTSAEGSLEPLDAV